MTRPAARPGRSTGPPQIASPSGASPAFLTPKGSVPSQGQTPYLTSERLYWIASALSDRDRELLRFVHDSRFASGQQLIRAFWQTEEPMSSQARAGRRALKRLTDWRVLDTLPRRIGGMRTGSDGLIYRTGRAGTKLLAAGGVRGARVEIPGTLHLAHTLATTELALRLREGDQAGELELIEVQQEPACWRTYPGAGGVERALKPDLFARIGAGALEDRWMVEVDLASESGRTIAAKLARYVEHYRSGREQHGHGTYPKVLWVVPDEHRAEQIAGMLAATPAGTKHLFAVCLRDQVVEHLASEARS
jgi:hypothetical protein